MATQLLFYNQVTPLSAELHRDLSVKAGDDYRFAHKVNAVPLMLSEIPFAAREYCIVFAGSESEPMPVALLGAAREENLYVDARGKWSADYVPAFVRRYPFVFSRSEDGRTFTLCIDEAFDGCNRAGRGERLFDADGERTTYLGKVLQFERGYQAEHQRTQMLCRQLAELDLLESIQAQIRSADGESRLLTGTRAVNRAKLKALEGEALAAMVRTDALELIYLHLHSLHNLRGIGARLPADVESKPDPAAEESASGERLPDQHAPAGDDLATTTTH